MHQYRFPYFFLFPRRPSFFFLFFFNDTATTEIYTLSLHDALPISLRLPGEGRQGGPALEHRVRLRPDPLDLVRSEEHTSELQSHLNLVCRLLLEKKKKRQTNYHSHVYAAQKHHHRAADHLQHSL